MNVKKILKVIVFIIVVLFLIVIIHLLRNYYIISNLQNKVNEFALSKNYHMKQIIENESSYILLDMYQTEKQGKLVERRISLENSNTLEEITIFKDTVTTYSKVDSEKNIRNDSLVQPQKIQNMYKLYTSESNSNILIELLNTKITTIKYNNKKCYSISNSVTNNMYVDKETGLLLRKLNGISTSNGTEIEYKYTYEFNSVTDEDVLEPDINEYQ